MDSVSRCAMQSPPASITDHSMFDNDSSEFVDPAGLGDATPVLSDALLRDFPTLASSTLGTAPALCATTSVVPEAVLDAVLMSDCPGPSAAPADCVTRLSDTQPICPQRVIVEVPGQEQSSCVTRFSDTQLICPARESAVMPAQEQSLCVTRFSDTQLICPEAAITVVRVDIPCPPRSHPNIGPTPTADGNTQALKRERDG